MKIEEDFDKIFEKASGQELTKPKTEQEALQSHLQEIGKFLNPPYIFNLPPPGLTRREFHQLDPDYHYLCRNNSRANIINSIEAVIRNPILNLSQNQKEELKKSIDEINQFPLDTKRTIDDMLIIKQTIVKALNILEKSSLKKMTA